MADASFLIDPAWFAQHEDALDQAHAAVLQAIKLLTFPDGTAQTVVRGRATLALEHVTLASQALARSRLPWLDKPVQPAPSEAPPHGKANRRPARVRRSRSDR